MKNVAIIGVGLIGGSLGMALRAVRRGGKPCYRVTGIGRDRTRLMRAIRRGAADAVTVDAAAGIAGADIVVIGTPVDAVAATVAGIAPHLKAGAVVTDVGSIKAGIVAGIKKAAPSVNFVGSHPMAGSEKSGVDHAERGMLSGAVVVLTPGTGTGGAAFRTVERMWKDAGSRVVRMTEREHDRLVAVTSHLPHAISFTLCRQAGAANSKNPHTSLLVAGSFRDMSRIADSDTRQWAAIASGNGAELGAAIDCFCRDLQQLRRFLKNPRKLEKFFDQGRLARARLVK